jgi:hypothetical protein
MPYPIAHPAAVIPLMRPMGRFGVPSALVIGSMAPDLWYFVPLLARDDSHSAAGLFWFCLPAGFVLYFAFHLVFKEPLAALAPRFTAFYRPGLPRAPLYAVALSLFVGILTHFAWDALTHAEGRRLAQHASTLLGTAYVLWWVWRRLREVPTNRAMNASSKRIWVFAALGVAAAGWAWHQAAAAHLVFAYDVEALRLAFRVAGIGALEGLALALVVYCSITTLLGKGGGAIFP